MMHRMYKPVNDSKKIMPTSDCFVKEVVSGGQTGVDRAAHDAARKRNIPQSGWCPKGRRAENTCDVLLALEPFDEKDVDKLPISSEVAYVRIKNSNQLFYVNKFKKKCVDIRLMEEQLEEFDKALKPTYQARRLKERDLEKIKSTTGYSPEDGIIPDHYNLRETPTAVYEQRTEWTARDSDGTLIIVQDEPMGGTLYTIEMAKKHNKPFYLLELTKEKNLDGVAEWILANHIQKLNVAGPRASQTEGIYNMAYTTVEGLLAHDLLNQAKVELRVGMSKL